MKLIVVIVVVFYFNINREIAAKASSPAKDNRNTQPYSGGYGPPLDGEPNSFQLLRHSQIIQQCSSSTDEGCDTDHGEMEDVIQPSVPPSSIHRLNSYASSSSSSGVVTNFPSKSLSQNLSCDSSRSNFSTFESLDLNLSDCSDLAASLPSCATTIVNTMNDNVKDHGKIYLQIFLTISKTLTNKMHFFDRSNSFITFHLFMYYLISFCTIISSKNPLKNPFNSCFIFILSSMEICISLMYLFASVQFVEIHPFFFKKKMINLFSNKK